jgi:signal transduction histidine kinase
LRAFASFKWFPYISKVTLLTLLYYLSGEISFSISSENSIVTIVIFASEGFALASVLLFGKRMWLGIFIGQLLLAYGSMPFLAGVSIALINSLEAILAVMLFDYFKLNRNLSTTRDVFGLIYLIVFVLQPLSALFGNSILMAFSMMDLSDFGKNFFSWWFGNMMGQILLVPTFLLLYEHRKKVKIIELILIALFFTLVSYLFQIVIPIHNVSLLLSVTLPLIIYLSSCKGIEYATFSIVVITMVTLYLTHLNVGIFTTENKIGNIINLNFYFLSQVLLLLIIGTLFEEKKRREVTLKKLVDIEVKKNQEHTLMMLQQSRLAQMGQVLNMIAHQWRQPLNYLLISNDILLYKYEEGEMTTQEMKRFEEETSFQIKQMSRTIDDFRDFFKPKKEKEKFLLNDVIERLLLMTKPIFIVSEISISFKEEEGLYSDGYPNELAQAILNILYNAKDALSDEAIEDKSISILLKSGEGKNILEISDNGGGIPEDILENIFESYFSTKEKDNGTGLGLYMSKLIVEKHKGGELFATNNEKGATFTLILEKSE